MSNPELAAKPIAVILMQDDERDEWNALTRPQQGYVLHWMRSNTQHKNRRGSIFTWNYRKDLWAIALRKAKEQRP